MSAETVFLLHLHDIELGSEFGEVFPVRIDSHVDQLSY